MDGPLNNSKVQEKVLSGMDERAAKGSPGRGPDAGGQGDEEDE